MRKGGGEFKEEETRELERQRHTNQLQSFKRERLLIDFYPSLTKYLTNRIAIGLSN